MAFRIDTGPVPIFAKEYLRICSSPFERLLKNWSQWRSQSTYWVWQRLPSQTVVPGLDHCCFASYREHIYLAHQKRFLRGLLQ